VPAPMLRPSLTLLFALVVTSALVALTAEPGAPPWTALVGGLGSGFLAAAVVALEEGLVEDGLKGVIFAFLGGALLVMGLPGWVAWPLVVGPWVGFVANRGRAPTEPHQG